MESSIMNVNQHLAIKNLLVVLLALIPPLITACNKDDCTKIIQTDSYWSGGAYINGTKTEVPCDFPEPGPLVGLKEFSDD